LHSNRCVGAALKIPLTDTPGSYMAFHAIQRRGLIAEG